MVKRGMKRLFAAVICGAMIWGINCNCLETIAEEKNENIAEGVCGVNIFWSIDKDNTLNISGWGKMYDFVDSGEGKEVPWKDYKSDIKEVVIEDEVTAIGSHSFCGMLNLKKVKLGNSVKTIGEEAFLFDESLGEIIMPDSVEIIGDSAFAWCYALENVTFSNKLKEIQDGAFNTAGLKKVELPDSLEKMGKFVFEVNDNLEEVIWTKGINEIPEMTFSMCSELKKITIPDNLTSIKKQAFWGCSLDFVAIAGDTSCWDKLIIEEDNDGLSNVSVSPTVKTDPIPEESISLDYKDLAGTYDIDVDKTIGSNGTSLQSYFGSGIKYGWSMILGADQSASWSIGIGYGGEGTYEFTSDEGVLKYKDYENGMDREVKLQVKREDGKNYMIMDLGDYRLYWFKTE